MKKFTILFLIFLCLSFNITPAVLISDTFKEGTYTKVDFIPSPNNVYTITNISEEYKMHVFVFNENELIVQDEQLLPGSPKKDTIPLLPGYLIAVVGYGEVTIVPKSP